MKRKRLYVVLLILVGVPVIAVVILSLIAPRIDITRYRQEFADVLSQHLHRQVELDGKLFLTLSYQPAVMTEGIRIANPDWSRSAFFFQAEQAKLAIDLPDLLLGRITLSQLRLRQARLNLEQGADGRYNWSFAPGTPPSRQQSPQEQPSPTPQQGPSLRLEDVTLEQVQIDFYSPQGQRKLSLQHATLDRSVRGRYQLHLTGALDKQKLSVEAISNRWFDLQDIQPLKMDVTAALGANRLSAQATVQQFVPRVQADIRLASSRLDIDEVLRLLPPAKPAQTKPTGESSLEQGLHLVDSVSFDLTAKHLRYQNYDFKGTNLQGRLSQDVFQKKDRFAVKVSGGIAEIVNQKAAPAATLGQGDGPSGGQARFSLHSRGDTPEQLLQALHVELTAENFSGHRPKPYHVDRIAVHTDAEHRLEIEGAFTYNTVPVVLHAQTGNRFIDDLRRRDMAHVNVDIKSGEAELTVHSTTRHIFSKQARRLHLRVAGKHLAVWSPVFGRALPELDRYRLESRLEFKPDLIRATSFSLSADNSKFQGKLAYRYGKSRHTLNARLEKSRLTLADFQAAAVKDPDMPQPAKPEEKTSAKKAANQQKTKEMVIPRTDLMALLSPPLNFNLEVVDSDVFFSRLAVKRMSLKMRWVNEALSVQISQGQVADGQLIADVYLAVVDHEVAGKIETHIKQLDYGRFMQDMKIGDKMKGTANINIYVVGFGKDLKEYLSRSDGAAEFVGKKGVLDSTYLKLWAGDIVTQILPFNWFGSDRANINCVVGRFDLSEGKLSSDSLLLDTEPVTVAGSGAIDLKTEKLHFKLTPDPKNPSLISLATPIEIRGTLAHPSVEPHALGATWTIGSLLAGLANPSLLIARFAKLGSLGENPCLAAVGDKKKGDTSVRKAFKDAVQFLQRPLDNLPDIE